MRKLILFSILCLIAIIAQAQPTSIPVNFKGTRPTIADFFTAYYQDVFEDISSYDCPEAEDWLLYLQGLPTQYGTFTVDVHNGYLRYEIHSSYDNETWDYHNEMCFWNCADGKHRLVAISDMSFKNGLPFYTETTGFCLFLLYDNDTRRMEVIDANSIGGNLDDQELGFSSDTPIEYRLPQQGKDIHVTIHASTGKAEYELIWEGDHFHCIALPLISIARIGSFDDIQTLKQSERYQQLCQWFPELKDINHAEVDLGEGDWWFIKPLEEHMSMAVNEYTFEMFLGEQSEDDARILLRTEEAEPILLRISTYDPGSVKINLVASGNRTLTWIPTETPTEGELRPAPGVAIIR